MLIALAKTLSAALAAEQKMASGLPTLMPDLSVFVGGTTMTCAQVVAQTEQHINAEEHILSLKAQLKEAQTNIKPVRVQQRATAKAVKAAAAVAFGDTSAKFQDLGFTPAKPRKTTVAAKAEGIEKSHATREARGTKGSRQKAAIHGTVAATSAPVASSAAPATPATVK
jgi:hypothetical protein